MKSILQQNKACYICHDTRNVQKHHIYEGSRRQMSERNGFWVYLCPEHHNLGSFSVHRDPALNRWMKKLCQMRYEEGHAHDDFMKLVGKNYLEVSGGNLS